MKFQFGCRGLALACAAVLAVGTAGCASSGQNRIYTVIPKREVLQSHDLTRVTKRTKDCYNVTAAAKIAQGFCKANATAMLVPKDPRAGSGASAAEIKKCMDLVLDVDDGRASFKKPLYKSGYKIDPKLLDDKNAIAESCQHELERAPLSVAASYWNRKLPYIASDIYDTVTTRHRKIRIGDPVSVIVNKVWLQSNSEWFIPFGNAEVAVVLTVDDGSEEKPEEILVSYSDGISDKSGLPISDLLAYSTDKYLGQPIRISILVYEMDKLENGAFSQLISTAASTIGVLPTLPGTSTHQLASALGSFITSNNKDDKILQLDFEVYPWQDDKSSSEPSNFGVPRIARTNYLVVNSGSGSPAYLRPRGQLQLGHGLTPYVVDPAGPAWAPGQKNGTHGPYDFPAFYDEKVIASEKEPDALPASYMVITINNTKLVNASNIIKRANEVNRAASKLAASKSLDASALGSIGALAENLLQSVEITKVLNTLEGVGDITASTLLEVVDGYDRLKGKFGNSPQLADLRTRLNRIAPERVLNDCNQKDLTKCTGKLRSLATSRDVTRYSLDDEEGRFEPKK